MAGSTILDLSGVPGTVLVQLVGSSLRIIYEALNWSRRTQSGICYLCSWWWRKRISAANFMMPMSDFGLKPRAI
ncbi:hypothetical protein K5P26_04965 [Sphingopyxis sp. XHP0097]|jgi:hypothetical protein|uniref:Uncharacterized protein n=1 Tax=Sphingopyxis jiangsuensis TaxID=2871171 RepID=A0ABS7MBY7_9SPHN|nr:MULTISPECIES: hypothetical protein [Sphingopyxis]MBY4636489.1 hypothetical protein [Sphingopyxis jiangsuensis]